MYKYNVDDNMVHISVFYAASTDLDCTYWCHEFDNILC